MCLQVSVNMFFSAPHGHLMIAFLEPFVIGFSAIFTDDLKQHNILYVFINLFTKSLYTFLQSMTMQSWRGRTVEFLLDMKSIWRGSLLF
jgi:hypothetical protein